MEISCFMASLSVVTAWLASCLFVAELSWWRKFNPLFSKWIPKWLLAQERERSFQRSFVAFRATRAVSNRCSKTHAHVQQVANNTRSLSIFESFGDGKLMENVRELVKNLLQCCRRFEAMNMNDSQEFHSIYRKISPAMAKCLMKKFIRDFRLLLISKVTRTAVFPRTMTANSIHNTVNCSVCEWKIGKISLGTWPETKRCKRCQGMNFRSNWSAVNVQWL